MKAQILKIAGVKSEKEFYKKYPSEEAFMKVHSKAFKKAQMGTYIGGTSVATPKMVNYGAEYDTINKMITGSTDAEKRAAAEKAEAAKKDSGGGGGMDMSSIMGMFGGGARYGADIPNAQWGTMTPGGSNNWQNSWQEEVNNTQNNPYGTYAPGNYSENDIDNNGVPDLVQNPEGNPLASGQGPATEENEDSTFDAMKGVPIIGGIIGGMQALEKQKEAKKAAKQAKLVSDVTLKASATRPEETKRRYNTPWDNPIQAGQMFPTYGVGTNPLARDGVRLQGGGEIQNTYAPGYLYDDLGYEPLNDSNVKQYYNGGDIPRAQYGLASAGGEGFGENPYGGMASGMMGNNNAGSQIGGSIGSAFGPVGGLFGSMVGGMLDTDQHDIDKYNKQTKKNIQGMAINNMIPGIQSGYRSHMKDGGYMNPEYNPQVITMFGDHNSQDFADYAHKDQYRAGGHLQSYTPPSDRAMETYRNGGGIKSYGLGGELQTHWGGGAETISHNPYLPGTGETVMFRGKSHEERSPNGETGIGVTYGGSPVEVERGEPMVELEEGGTIDPETGEVQKSGVVFGNLKIPNQYIDMLGDKNAKGKKFKNYVNDLSKIEAKQNKVVEKATNELNGFVPQNSFDKLKLSALQASIQGANMKLKSIADKKINAASLQNAINDTAEENGLVADDLARGKVKIDKEAQSQYAKFGGSFTKAQDGKKTIKGRGDKWDYTEIGANQTNPQWQTEEAYNTQWSPKVDKALDDSERAKKILNYIKTYKGPNASKVQAALNKFPTEKAQLDYLRAHAKDREISDMHYLMDAGIQSTEPAETKPAETKPATETKKEEEKIYPIEATKRNPWIDAASQILPYFRPSDQEGLDMAQLYPEMFAMATNQLEPVPAQGYRPDLGTPYDISFQDQLNANQADYNASQRMVGYNPAAQSSLNAQKYQANQQVLGSQFRANQEMKDKVYGENRNILNQAKLQNLEIFDRQYGRQSEAKSNTKATTQAALNSISDKYAKNKLENRTLGVMENMYNYRYDNQGRAVNMNAPWQPNVPTVYNKGDQTANMKAVYDQQGKFIRWEPIEKETTTEETTTPINNTVGSTNKKNGGNLKSRNGSIVKSYKNI